jgi:hypothetical protein
MIKDLINGFKKLTYSKKRKMIAGNQLTIQEKQAFIVMGAIMTTPFLITGVLFIVHKAFPNIF